MYTIVVIIAVLVAILAWRFLPRRGPEPGFKYVYVNQDGTARELSPDEQSYLSQEFSGFDGGRPYIKSAYGSRDGWGSRSGYIERRRVPLRVRILPVHPDYDTEVKKITVDLVEIQRAAGDIIVENPDGSVTCTPNPDIPRKRRFELARDHQLEQQRRREQLARTE